MKQMATAVSRSFMTSDGVRLNYLEAGSGKTLVMIPGWSQTAAQFKFQIDGLSDRYHVIAVDMRGHGDSDKPAFGYRIQRLATDVHELLSGLNLQDVTLLGHSMGSSVIWCYYDLFGADRVAKLALIDQSAFLTSNPAWSEQESADAGVLFTAEAVTATANALAGPDGAATTAGFIGGMLTEACPAEMKAWIIEQNMKFPRVHAAELLYNHCHQDWRDVVKRITLPTLVVGGRISLMPWKGVSWVGTTIPGARLEIFEADEGGQHFMFLENPDKFNRLVAELIDG
jgi:non-heme chloroperoxidase